MENSSNDCERKCNQLCKNFMIVSNNFTWKSLFAMSLEMI